MMKTIDIGMIHAKRKRLAEERAVHAQAIEAIDAQDADLAIVERVIDSLSSSSTRELDAKDQDPRPSSENHTEDKGRRRRKPDGIPKVPDMVREALSNAHSLGAPGLAPSGITSWIQGAHWPEVRPNDIGPDVWRMWKNGNLIKEGALYALPLDQRPNEKASDLSGSEA